MKRVLGGVLRPCHQNGLSPQRQHVIAEEGNEWGGLVVSAFNSTRLELRPLSDERCSVARPWKVQRLQQLVHVLVRRRKVAVAPLHNLVLVSEPLCDLVDRHSSRGEVARE